MKKRPEHPPIVVVDTIRNAVRLVALEDDRRLSGIRVEQTLSDARAIHPNLECLQYDPHATMTLLKKVARWCERYTPLVSLSGRDSLFLDITGCSHLFNGEKAMLEDMFSRLNGQGFGVKLAIADAAGAAWAMAHHSSHDIAPAKSHQVILEPLPLHALRLPQDKVVELAQLGFKTVGSLIEVPRAPISARFGPEVLQRLDQALGQEDEVLSPFQPVAELVYEKRFPDPVVYEEDIKATIRLLAAKLVISLEQRGLGLRKARLQLFRADGDVVFLEVEASNPRRDAKQIAALFDERLSKLHDEWDAGFGFDIIQLCVLRSERLDAQQEDMVAHNHAKEAAMHLVDRLTARLGADRVQVFQTSDTHIPERRFNLAPAVHYAPEVKPYERTDLATRPVLLFERPELADVMAEVPEGPPIRFRWRRAHYEVVCSEGPERIACEWWRDGRTAKTRDYFRIETTEGYRLWLFRDGLYERETDAPKWYVHGMFA
ncbi:MAG: DNA polymerase Y family protein [Pseudomonadota bacterium]